MESAQRFLKLSPGGSHGNTVVLLYESSGVVDMWCCYYSRWAYAFQRHRSTGVDNVADPVVVVTAAKAARKKKRRTKNRDERVRTKVGCGRKR